MYTEQQIQNLLQARYEWYVNVKKENEFKFLLEKYKDQQIQELYNYFTNKDMANYNVNEFYKLMEKDEFKNKYKENDIKLMVENHTLKLLCKWNLLCEEYNIDFEKCITSIYKNKSIDEKEYYSQLLDEKIRELEEYDLESKKYGWKNEFYKKMMIHIETIKDKSIKEEYIRKVQDNEEEYKIRANGCDEKRSLLVNEIDILQRLAN